MGQGCSASGGQDNGPDRGSHVADSGHDHGCGLAHGDRNSAAGWRGVDPDVPGRPAGTGQGSLKEVIPPSPGRRVRAARNSKM